MSGGLSILVDLGGVFSASRPGATPGVFFNQSCLGGVALPMKGPGSGLRGIRAFALWGFLFSGSSSAFSEGESKVKTVHTQTSASERSHSLLLSEWSGTQMPPLCKLLSTPQPPTGGAHPQPPSQRPPENPLVSTPMPPKPRAVLVPVSLVLGPASSQDR